MIFEIKNIIGNVFNEVEEQQEIL